MFFANHYLSPAGKIILMADEENIIGLWFENQKYIESTMPSDMMINRDNPLLKAGIQWLDDYFSGRKPAIDTLPLAPAGSAFRQCIWNILKKIPYGRTTTYGKIAKEAAKCLGKEKMSAQAVGGAVAHNPISIIIPCHRVIGSDGSLTGYAGGTDIKIKLLECEGIDIGELRKSCLFNQGLS